MVTVAKEVLIPRRALRVGLWSLNNKGLRRLGIDTDMALYPRTPHGPRFREIREANDFMLPDDHH